jgi:hypothetical protein
MAAALKRFWDWANQPVSLGNKTKQPEDSIPVLDASSQVQPVAGLPEDIAALNLNLEDLASANDEVHKSVLSEPAESSNPEDYLGDNAEDISNGLERFLQAHEITQASEESWVQLLDEMKIIQLKRMRLTELENECIAIRAELQECKRNLALQAKRASAEESLTISMHEKRLELARALTRRVDAL